LSVLGKITDSGAYAKKLHPSPPDGCINLFNLVRRIVPVLGVMEKNGGGLHLWQRRSTQRALVNLLEGRKNCFRDEFELFLHSARKRRKTELIFEKDAKI
jgi:hypothetical protein